jgi:hypothetical protein
MAKGNPRRIQLPNRTRKRVRITKNVWRPIDGSPAVRYDPRPPSELVLVKQIRTTEAIFSTHDARARSKSKRRRARSERRTTKNGAPLEMVLSGTARHCTDAKEASMTLKEKVLIERNVDPRIADLVYFARYLKEKLKTAPPPVFDEFFSDEALIECAKDFWETRHGEE